MSLIPNSRIRVDCDGERADRVKVCNTGDFSDGSPLYGVTWDAVEKIVVSTTVDRYDYYEGGLGGTLKAQATITYTSTAKCDVQSAEYNII